jgi:hypothetical protein
MTVQTRGAQLHTYTSVNLHGAQVRKISICIMHPLVSKSTLHMGKQCTGTGIHCLRYHIHKREEVNSVYRSTCGEMCTQHKLSNDSGATFFPAAFAMVVTHC